MFLITQAALNQKTEGPVKATIPDDLQAKVVATDTAEQPLETKNAEPPVSDYSAKLDKSPKAQAERDRAHNNAKKKKREKR